MTRDAATAEGHHGLRNVELDDDTTPESAGGRIGNRFKRILRRQHAECAIDQAPGDLGVDVADNGHDEAIACKYAASIGSEIVLVDASDRLERAARVVTIGMVGESRAPPIHAGEAVRIAELAPQFGELLPANTLDGIGVETRPGEGKTQEFEGFLAVLAEGSQRTVEIIARHAEAEFYGMSFQPFAECRTVEIAGTFVQHVGHETGRTRFIRLVLSGAALEGEAHGDEGHSVFAHEPGFDSRRTDDRLDRHGRNRRDDERRKPGNKRRDRSNHKCLSAGGRSSLTR